jgi:hypothetical protein
MCPGTIHTSLKDVSFKYIYLFVNMKKNYERKDNLYYRPPNKKYRRLS